MRLLLRIPDRMYRCRYANGIRTCEYSNISTIRVHPYICVPAHECKSRI